MTGGEMQGQSWDLLKCSNVLQHVKDVVKQGKKSFVFLILIFFPSTGIAFTDLPVSTPIFSILTKGANRREGEECGV